MNFIFEKLMPFSTDWPRNLVNWKFYINFFNYKQDIFEKQVITMKKIDININILIYLYFNINILIIFEFCLLYNCKLPFSLWSDWCIHSLPKACRRPKGGQMPGCPPWLRHWTYVRVYSILVQVCTTIISIFS